MKKLSDVFELPIDTSAAFAYGYATIKNAAIIGPYPAAQHAARAINHADKLADALGVMIQHNWHAAHHRKEAQKVAELALAAYRGEA